MEIGEIKQQLTLAEVLKHYGLKPDKSLRLHCPFHEDKTPSLQIYYKTHIGSMQDRLGQPASGD
jgi:DNA primase